MYTPPLVKRVHDDDPITAEDRNYLAAQIDRRNVLVGPGLNADYTNPKGTYLWVSGAKLANLRMVYTQTGGIPAATTATVGTVVTLTPGTGVCWDTFGYNQDQTSSIDTSTTPGLTVYNDFTSVSGIAAGVGGKWVLVGDAANGTTRLIGDPC